MLDDNHLWLLSYYRSSELSGALFFGRLARIATPSSHQTDLTQHFAEEAQHAWAWTSCIDQLGHQPLPLTASYQDGYGDLVGLPVNLMEVLALTQVFERRVIYQYASHHRISGLHPQIASTLQLLLRDERRHLAWVRNALRGMEAQYSVQTIRETVCRYQQADREVFRRVLREHGERITWLGRHGNKENP